MARVDIPLCNKRRGVRGYIFFLGLTFVFARDTHIDFSVFERIHRYCAERFYFTFVRHNLCRGAWLIDSRGIASKVKNATQITAYQIRNNGANRECPNCHRRIDNSDVSVDWPGLPAGVKFDPSDVELLEHLAGKVRLGNSEPHLFIDEFIPTLEGDEGIYYTHPEDLPGAKKDGSSVHFFHRTANAYATGHRKRRKIHNQCHLTEEHVRWHKTGKTKPVLDNGVQKGWKKFMVLYKSSKKGSKPDKFNWVMHQYHLGVKDNEKEGDYVVSKIFYQQQQKQHDKSDFNLPTEESDRITVQASPWTPKKDTPNLNRPGKRPLFDEDDEEKESEFIQEATQTHLPAIRLDDEKVDASWWAGESQAVEDLDPNGVDDSLLCNEILDSYAPIDNPGVRNTSYLLDFNGSQTDAVQGVVGAANGIPDLDGIELGTPPDFELADLQFGSQESIMSWLDRL
ncbi:SUPPRESSOR OF GAMMA RESPONSE 1-like [Telopea speciosissima]|nr:SUPPRESSOR OF GAMMA RESPONSE 1-like [Telopea speciosissima]